MFKFLKKKKVQTIIIAFAASLLIILLNFLNVFDYMENKSYDSRVKNLSFLSKPSEQIVLILVDQGSIEWGNTEEGWSWPWPRAAYGDLLEFLKEGNAASCSFDIIFSEQSIYGANDDKKLAESSKNFGHAIQTVFLNTQTGLIQSWPENINKPSLKLENFEKAPKKMTEPFAKDKSILAVFPIEEIANAASKIGSVTGIPDSDDIFRRQAMFYTFEDKYIPELSIAALMSAGWPNTLNYNSKKQAIDWNNISIPVDSQGKVLLKFKGTLDRYFPYGISDILKSKYLLDKKPYDEMTEEEQEEVYFLPEDFEGKHVFVGYYAPGLYDTCSTPIESVYPGVGMHITLMDNILSNEFLRSSSIWFNLLLIFLAAFFSAYIALQSKRIISSILGFIFIVAIILGVAIGGYILNWWIPMIAPLSSLVASYVGAMLFNFSTEGKQKRLIKTTFKQYLSPAVIEILLAHPEKLKLGGERREITIFFSDVQGFTSISEKLDPEKLTELLNEYLSFMSGIIMESGGTIDKYEGDAIIAFWNAPATQEDHPLRALNAGLLCQKRLAEQLAFFKENYNANLTTRIGMNTGFAVVGNMGSKERFDYTMLGDSVNLASRLEGLNKQFGTYFMCTETTLTKANEEALKKNKPLIAARKLAIVAVVGKKEPVTVYEPMEQEQFTDKQSIFEQFDKGRDLFYEGKFSEALSIFKTIEEQDRPAYFYAIKCEEYIKNPPKEWLGFWQATSK